jgi:hypothetical protein
MNGAVISVIAYPNLCLSAIPMMGINIEDYGSLSCGERNIEGFDRIVVMTESEPEVCAGMMPWRTCQDEPDLWDL